jgi:hypothetical protein
MKIVGIYLFEHVFTRGQLYVVLSQAMNVNDISIFCLNGRTMTNVVYTDCCNDLSSLSFACFSLLMGRNSHIQITS